jgi:hypothetical protein
MLQALCIGAGVVRADSMHAAQQLYMAPVVGSPRKRRRLQQ